MSQCPLSDSDVYAVITEVPEVFDTLDFIERCPLAGGRSGQKCHVVQRSGGRRACGRRLGDYQRSFPEHLTKDASRSPARWQKLPGLAKPDFGSSLAGAFRLSTSHTTQDRARRSTPDDRYGPARPGHHDNARWLASDAMLAYKRRCDHVCGEGLLLFRPVDDGVVQLVLSENAPRFVGFRAMDDDPAHKLRTDLDLLDEAALRARWDGFRRWVKGVRRVSHEEQMVMALLRRALRDGLRVPGMNGDWRLLNHEWRFQDGGRGKKSDIMVFDSEGNVGIVEFKHDCAKLSEAKAQVRDYGRMYVRDQDALLPLFAEQAVGMVHLYGGDPAPTLRAGGPKLFVGCKGLWGVRFEEVA